VNSLGLIAGNGVFPLEVADAARRRGIRVIAIAHLRETRPELESRVDQITWIKVGELEKMIEVFHRADLSEVAMAGGISRERLKDSFAPDARAIRMLSGLGRMSDDAVLRGVAGEIEAEGITVIDPVPMVENCLAHPGLAAGPEPSEGQLRDLDLAFAVARQLGSFDIGQTVAVRDGIVGAVEAVEGTDAALRRAAALVGPRLIIAKAAKPGQDLRFDRPAIGPETIALVAEIGAAMLGVEAGVTLVLERERTMRLAAESKVSVYGHV
jgi:UDP-2,3-diacylglucosamine hydrolase